MSILAFVGALPVTQPQTPSRDGFDTPEPVYTDTPAPASLRDRPWLMEPHEKLRARTAAFRATRMYPGVVGEVLSKEILSWEEMGMRLDRNGTVMRLVDHILTEPA